MRQAALACGLFCPQILAAEGFTGEAFLTWSQADQKAYLNAQIVMASTIVTRAKPDMAACMARAFFSDAGLTDAQHDEILKTIQQYKTYHPSTVLVVLIEKNCGKFF